MTDFRALALKAAEIGIIEEEPAREALYWSPTLYRIFGLNTDVAPSGELYLSLTHPADREAVLDAFYLARQATEPRISTIEHRIVRRDGETRWLCVSFQTAIPEAGSGQPPRIICSLTDITQWKEKEEEAKHNQSWLRAVISVAPSAIISIDAQQRITLFNEAAEKLFGYSRDELVGQPLEVLLPQRFRSGHGKHVERFWSSAETIRRMAERQKVAGIRKDGSEFPAEASISKIEIGGERVYTVALQDTTEREIAAAQLSGMNRILEERVAERTRELEIEMKRREDAQKQLIQSQRMDAFGQLTGGIAHDFNNLPSIVTGSLELLEPDVRSAAARKHLERASNAAEMGARLTTRLLTFARRRRLEPTILNVNEQVTNLLELLHRTLGEQIVIRTALVGDPWLTKADPSEVENAILNLALNARDAMPGGGRLILGTANVGVDEGQAAEIKPLRPGDYVRLSVTDSGTGIAPEHLPKVFEPFFTTKVTGRGSGLGLSTLYGFATQSGGSATVYSEFGKGTTVNLYLPRAAINAEADTHASSRNARILFSKHNETVLVVEDNPEVRETTLQRIEGLGYVVTEAANGPDAIGVLESDPSIALVFSDVVMPGGISGYELGRWIKENKPEVKVVLASGFAAELTDLPLENEFAVLRKPFNRAELAKALSYALYGAED
jgi:PAS domain S-box-containing protein